jgi:hypothetical protein
MLWIFNCISGSSDAVAGKAEIRMRTAVARKAFRIVEDYPILLLVGIIIKNKGRP